MLASNRLSRVGNIESRSLLKPSILAASVAADGPEILSFSRSFQAESTLSSQLSGSSPSLLRSSLFSGVSPLSELLSVSETCGLIIRGAVPGVVGLDKLPLEASSEVTSDDFRETVKSVPW